MNDIVCPLLTLTLKKKKERQGTSQIWLAIKSTKSCHTTDNDDRKWERMKRQKERKEENIQIQNFFNI